jgi:hypothetical protein
MVEETKVVARCFGLRFQESDGAGEPGPKIVPRCFVSGRRAFFFSDGLEVVAEPVPSWLGSRDVTTPYSCPYLSADFSPSFLLWPPRPCGFV